MFTDLIYVTKARALESELTHEGHMFGVPAWFESDMDSADEFVGCTPKIPLLHLWCMLVEATIDFFYFFTSKDTVWLAPITVRGPIK